MNHKILGVDLASRSWEDNGSCLLTFDTAVPAWISVQSQVVDWPTDQLSPSKMAGVLANYVHENKIAGISLDGPQGWREPSAQPRKGVGRQCEYESRCQGKTGEFGKTYPAPQRGWIEFCIDVFKGLRERGARIPSVSQGTEGLPTLSGDEFWMIECFPTSIWRTSGIATLPGKRRAQRNQVDLNTFRHSLSLAYRLPPDKATSATHDDLQALVSALPMAALLGGPARAIPRGKDTWKCDAGHWVEGVIWDSMPLIHEQEENAEQTSVVSPRNEVVTESSDLSPNNPIVLDDRDDNSAEFFESGISLFSHLCELQAEGKSVGVSYSQFVKVVYSIADFADLLGRNYANSDTRFVLELAAQITEEAGGRRAISRNGATIQAGMDTFIWQKRSPHTRSESAFSSTPYTYEEWLSIFPDGERCLLSMDF